MPTAANIQTTFSYFNKTRYAHPKQIHLTSEQNIILLRGHLSPSTQCKIPYSHNTVFTLEGDNKYKHNTILTVYLSINQLYALNFIMSLFHASTCFKHMCSLSGGQNCTIQPRCDDTRGCIVQF